jgi:predicted SprT family Zn-dependent metalloprotease
MSYQDDLLSQVIWNEPDAIALLAEIFESQRDALIKTYCRVDDLPIRARLENLGFQAKREFTERGLRQQRFTCDRYDFIRALAEAKMAEHLDMQQWQFGFDSAKRRAGLCNYTNRTITVSRYLVDIHSVDETMQVVLHEIAHAICGKKAGHTKTWLQQAKAIGYRAEKFSGKEIAEETARWVGRCPAGHEHYRYRKPSRALACGLCGRGFSRRNLIQWQTR